MYAIFKTGGKQYRVSKGDIIFIEKINSNADDIVTFNDILLINDDNSLTVGTPFINNASISAKVIKNGKAKKIRVFTYKPKKNSKRLLGHRQPYTKIQIESINL